MKMFLPNLEHKNSPYFDLKGILNTMKVLVLNTQLFANFKYQHVLTVEAYCITNHVCFIYVSYACKYYWVSSVKYGFKTLRISEK